MTAIWCQVLSIFALAVSAVSHAQSVTQGSPPATHPADVVVKGLRDIDRADAPVTHETLGSMKSAVPASDSRHAMESSRLFAKCAVRMSADKPGLLRAILDGEINSAQHRFAQMRFVRGHAACAVDPQRAQRVGVAADRGSMSAAVGTGDGAALSASYEKDGVTGGAGSVTDEMGSYYDRGALFLEVLRQQAPSLVLDSERTNDRQVQARFDAREVPLARFRLPLDRQFFEIAVCMVRLQPVLAIQLVNAQKPALIASIEAAMVSRARICVGNAKKVYFDPTQFQFYIADATYRWIAAAAGARTLVASSN